MRRVITLSYSVGFPLVPLLFTNGYNRHYAIEGDQVLFDDRPLFPPQEFFPGSKKSQSFQLYSELNNIYIVIIPYSDCSTGRKVILVSGHT